MALHRMTRATIPDKLRSAKEAAIEQFLRVTDVVEATALAVSVHPHDNVVGIGIGRKLVNGRPTDTPAVRFYVERKVAKGALPADLMLPKSVNGVATDVIESGRFRAPTAAAGAARRIGRLQVPGPGACPVRHGGDVRRGRRGLGDALHPQQQPRPGRRKHAVDRRRDLPARAARQWRRRQRPDCEADPLRPREGGWRQHGRLRHRRGTRSETRSGDVPPQGGQAEEPRADRRRRRDARDEGRPHHRLYDRRGDRRQRDPEGQVRLGGREV